MSAIVNRPVDTTASAEIKGAPPVKVNHTAIRLADFMLENIEHIVAEWEAFARTLRPAANHMTPLVLRNHIHELLAFIVRDINSPQSNAQQIAKSHGEKQKSAQPTAAETHAALRLAGGFDIDQMVSEYRSLRASVIKLWGLANPVMGTDDMIDLTRFNEAIDQELTESVSLYTKSVGYSKDMLFAILSHDLRNPLNAISMSAQLSKSMGGLTERQKMLNTQILESTSRIAEIIDDLLDVTRARFGSKLPVVRIPMDMGFVSKQVVDEMRIIHPTRIIILEVTGNLKGEWDKARIGQVFSNLIGNALQYSFKDSSIFVNVKGTPTEAVLSVRNEGIPIASDKIETIFAALTRTNTEEHDYSGSVNLGLGLYITKEIAISHGGNIAVTSTEEDGTEFIVHLPR